MARSKGTGSLYKRASDNMWVGVVELPPGPDGKRRRKPVARKNKADAIRELRRIRDEYERRGDLSTAQPPTLNAWIDDWWQRYATKKLKISVWDDYEGKIRLYIRPSIGSIRIDKLEPKHVHRLHAYITEPTADRPGLSSSTANGVHQVLRAILRDALKEDLVRRNVAAIIPPPPRSTQEEDYLDSSDARKLLASMDPGDGTVTADLMLRALAYLAGLRQGERLGLTEEFFDMERREITVAWSLTRLTYKHGCGEMVNGEWPCGRRKGGYCPQKALKIPDNQDVRHVSGGLHLVRPKTKSAWRVVPMVGLLYEIAKLYLESDHYEPGPHGMLFTRRSGKTGKVVPISGDWDSRNLARLLDEADLRRVRGHSARHTCNTLLIELGVPDDVRLRIIGHAALRSNATYTHTSDARIISAIDAIGHELDWRRDVDE